MRLGLFRTMAAMRATGAAAVAAAFAAAIACAVLYQMADGQAKQDSECRCNEEGYHKTAPFIGGIMRLPLPNGGGVPRYGSGPGGTCLLYTSPSPRD